MRMEEQALVVKLTIGKLDDGTPYEGKLSCTVWSGGKSGDHFKGLPIAIKLIPGEVRDNLSVRVGCGRLKPSASLMMFDSSIGQRVHASPRGGMYVQVHGTGNMGQGFFAPNSWLNEHYEKNGLFTKEDSVKPAEAIAELDDTMKKAPKEFVEYWDSEMEELHEAGNE